MTYGDLIEYSHYFTPLDSKKEAEVTVCIAAIYEGRGIIGASDRMRTNGDITFESSQKFFGVTPSIAIMTAGDSSFQTEILIRLSEQIQGNVSSLSVEDITDEYLKSRTLIIMEKLDHSVFSLWGLTAQKFLEQASQLPESIIHSIAKERLYYLQSIPKVSAIITGVDNNGSQIYVVHNGEKKCHNTIGFAAIGSGARHAALQFMLSKYVPVSNLSETLLLTHTAKKNSEIAPGVGESTDMFFIELESGKINADVLHDDVIKKLDDIYQRTIVRSKNRIQRQARKEIDQYINAIRTKSSPPIQASA